MQKNAKILLDYPQYQKIIDQYINLDEFKGNAISTLNKKRITIISFFNYLGDNNVAFIDNCLKSHVSSFMESQSFLSTATQSGKRFIIRHFFNFLYDQCYILYSGNELFPVIVTNKRDRIISFYSALEVQKLISCVNNTSTRGKRDLIIVLLAAELGIRSGDICRLKITDIHWERNTIEFIQCKTNIFNQLPLLENIKFALIDYLKNSRPSCDSNLIFIGVKNHYQMLSASQMHSIVSNYFKMANLDISKRKHGPHALRHSLASQLLKDNTPMYVIKDILGHTNLNTTKTYLNIDFKTLKYFALEVPNEDKE